MATSKSRVGVGRAASASSLTQSHKSSPEWRNARLDDPQMPFSVDHKSVINPAGLSERVSSKTAPRVGVGRAVSASSIQHTNPSPKNSNARLDYLPMPFSVDHKTVRAVHTCPRHFFAPFPTAQPSQQPQPCAFVHHSPRSVCVRHNSNPRPVSFYCLCLLQGGPSGWASACKSVAVWEMQLDQRMHLERLKNIKMGVDNSAPRTFGASKVLVAV